MRIIFSFQFINFEHFSFALQRKRKKGTLLLDYITLPAET